MTQLAFSHADRLAQPVALAPGRPVISAPRLARARRRDAWEFRVMLAAVFEELLGFALLTWPVRLFTKRSGPRPSVFRKAWAKANACVPFVFMS